MVKSKTSNNCDAAMNLCRKAQTLLEKERASFIRAELARHKITKAPGDDKDSSDSNKIEIPTIKKHRVTKPWKMPQDVDPTTALKLSAEQKELSDKYLSKMEEKERRWIWADLDWQGDVHVDKEEEMDRTFPSSEKIETQADEPPPPAVMEVDSKGDEVVTVEKTKSRRRRKKPTKKHMDYDDLVSYSLFHEEPEQDRFY